MIFDGVMATIGLTIAAYFIGYRRGKRSFMRSVLRATLESRHDMNVYGTGVIEFGTDEVRHVPLEKVVRT